MESDIIECDNNREFDLPKIITRLKLKIIYLFCFCNFNEILAILHDEIFVFRYEKKKKVTDPLSVD